MISFLNNGSLVLGLIAWILPIINLMQYKKNNNKNWATLSIISMAACSISLCFQIIYNNHLVQIRDWTALMDTMGTLVLVALVLLVVTIILNAITVVIYSNRTAE